MQFQTHYLDPPDLKHTTLWQLVYKEQRPGSMLREWVHGDVNRQATTDVVALLILWHCSYCGTAHVVTLYTAREAHFISSANKQAGTKPGSGSSVPRESSQRCL
eukprot:419230-Pelagomonas_calceolata.AAC.1